MSEGTVPSGVAPGAVPGMPAQSEDAWARPGSVPSASTAPPPVPPPPGAPLGPSPGTTAGPVGYGPGGTAYPSRPSPVAGSGQPRWQPAWGAAAASHKPGIIALRPLGLGDIVEGGFASLRRNPRTFLGLALLTSLAVLVLAGVLFLVGYLVAGALQSPDTLDTFMAFGLTSYVAAMLFLSSATSIVLSGMLAYPVGEAVLGRRPSVGETWRRTRRMVPRLLRLCLVLVLPPTIVFGALIALVVWGFAGGLPALGVVGLLGVAGLTVAMVWVGTKVALATPALVLEDIGAIPALRRAWWLTTGLFWRTLGILLLSGVLIGIVQYVLSVAIQLGGMLLGLAAASMLGGSSSEEATAIVMVVVSVLGGLASGIVTQPFLAAVTALLYTDSRIRREGFDLALARAAAADAGNAGRSLLG